MYCEENFKTKKALKEAVASGKVVRVYQPNAIVPVPREGKVYLEGPHYPEPHRWYATAILKEGKVVKVS